MLRVLGVFCAAVIAVSGVSLSKLNGGESSVLSGADPPVKAGCLTEENLCASAYQTCLIHPECSKLLTCQEKCLDDFDADTSPMKSTTQTCLGTCLFSYADFYYTGFARCLTDNHCFRLQKVTTSCRYHNGVKGKRKFQISDLKGGWWKVRGYNPAYDCQDCPHTFFDGFEFDKTQFTYRPTFEIKAENGSNILVNGSITEDLKNTEPGDPIIIDYYAFGLPTHMAWYVLDGPLDNSTLLVYYCGYTMSEWHFEGAMILSRSPVVKATDEKKFEEMVKANTDLDYSKFCKPKLEPCSN